MSGLPNNPYKYAQKLGNHPTILAALGQLQPESRFRAADLLRRFALVLHDEEYRNLFLDSTTANSLTGWISKPPKTETLEILVSLNLLPTPQLVHFIEENNSGAAKGLEETMVDINNAKFDPANPLHVELEYSKYKRNGILSRDKLIVRPYLDFAEFKNLPVVGNSYVILPQSEHTHAKLAAKEALHVYEFIKQKIDKRVPNLVIANERYGGQFVVRPLAELLTDLGLKVVHEHVSSRAFDTHSTAYKEWINNISLETWQHISQRNPNIFVVDGTVRSEHEGKTRFPAAMWGYVNSFNQYTKFKTENSDIAGYLPAGILDLWKKSPAKGYNINFYAPKLTERIFVGNYEYKVEPRIEGLRELTIISSTCSQIGSSYACFDDPENYINYHSQLAFTPKGLSHLPLATDVAAFISTIQEIIAKEVTQLVKQN